MDTYAWVDGNDVEHTIYISGVDGDLYVQSEDGWDDSNIDLHIEDSPDRFSSHYRGFSYRPRDYVLTVTIEKGTPADLKAAKSDWKSWHNRELGEGYIKRSYTDDVGAILVRCLDCIPGPAKWTELAPSVAQVVQHYTAAWSFWRDASPTTANCTMNALVTIGNSGFETGGTGDDFNGGAEVDDGTSDDFTDWTEVNSDVDGDKTEATATKQAGSYAVKLIFGIAESSVQSGNLTVVPGETLKLAFQARGDAILAGQYQIYDVSNAGDIQAKATTGVTAAAYAEVTQSFTVPSGCTSLYVKFYSPGAAGTAYVDAVSLMRTTQFLSCANAGDIPAPIVATFTGVCHTPKMTNSDDDYLELAKVAANADDVLIADTRFRGDTRRYNYFQEHGAGATTPVSSSSGSEPITLPLGTNYLEIAGADGEISSAALVISWYNYYAGLY